MIDAWLTRAQKRVARAWLAEHERTQGRARRSRASLTAPLAGAANGTPTGSDPSKDAIRALTLRGQALNRTYHLGESAGETGSSFTWRTVGFAAAAGFGAILVAFAGTVGVRRRRAVIARLTARVSTVP